MLILINNIIDFAASFIFALGGYAIAKQAGKNPLLPVMSCALGGGLIRDVALACLTGHMVTPVAFSAYSNWFAASLAVAYCLILERAPNHTNIRSRRFGLYAYTLIDYAGAGLFLAAGVKRTMFFDIQKPIFLMLFGSISAVGGGLIARLLFLKKQRIASVLQAVPYYLTVFVTSVVIVSSNALVRNADLATFLTLASCASAGAGTLYMRELTPPMLLPSGQGTKLAQRLGLYISPGAYFQLVQNPRKGIRRWITFPSGVGTGFQFVAG